MKPVPAEKFQCLFADAWCVDPECRTLGCREDYETRATLAESESEAFRANVSDYFAPCPNGRAYRQWQKEGDQLPDDVQDWLTRKGAAKDVLKHMVDA